MLILSILMCFVNIQSDLSEEIVIGSSIHYKTVRGGKYVKNQFWNGLEPNDANTYMPEKIDFKVNLTHVGIIYGYEKKITDDLVVNVDLQIKFGQEPMSHLSVQNPVLTRKINIIKDKVVTFSDFFKSNIQTVDNYKPYELTFENFKLKKLFQDYKSKFQKKEYGVAQIMVYTTVLNTKTKETHINEFTFSSTVQLR